MFEQKCQLGKSRKVCFKETKPNFSPAGCKTPAKNFRNQYTMCDMNSFHSCLSIVNDN